MLYPIIVPCKPNMCFRCFCLVLSLLHINIENSSFVNCIIQKKLQKQRGKRELMHCNLIMLILNFKTSFHSAQHQKYQTALFMKIQKSTSIHGVKSLIGMTLMMDGMKKEGRLSYLKMNETCCNPKECLHIQILDMLY